MIAVPARLRPVIGDPTPYSSSAGIGEAAKRSGSRNPRGFARKGSEIDRRGQIPLARLDRGRELKDSRFRLDSSSTTTRGTKVSQGEQGFSLRSGRPPAPSQVRADTDTDKRAPLIPDRITSFEAFATHSFRRCLRLVYSRGSLRGHRVRFTGVPLLARSYAGGMENRNMAYTADDGVDGGGGNYQDGSYGEGYQLEEPNYETGGGSSAGYAHSMGGGSQSNPGSLFRSEEMTLCQLFLQVSV